MSTVFQIVLTRPGSIAFTVLAVPTVSEAVVVETHYIKEMVVEQENTGWFGVMSSRRNAAAGENDNTKPNETGNVTGNPLMASARPVVDKNKLALQKRGKVKKIPAVRVDKFLAMFTVNKWRCLVWNRRERRSNHRAAWKRCREAAAIIRREGKKLVSAAGTINCSDRLRSIIRPFSSKELETHANDLQKLVEEETASFRALGPDASGRVNLRNKGVLEALLQRIFKILLRWSPMLAGGRLLSVDVRSKTISLDQWLHSVVNALLYALQQRNLAYVTFQRVAIESTQFFVADTSNMGYSKLHKNPLAKIPFTMLPAALRLFGYDLELEDVMRILIAMEMEKEEVAVSDSTFHGKRSRVKDETGALKNMKREEQIVETFSSPLAAEGKSIWVWMRVTPS